MSQSLSRGASVGDVQGTWRPLRNFSRKELRKLRVTRAVAARITSKLVFHCDFVMRTDRRTVAIELGKCETV